MVPVILRWMKNHYCATWKWPSSALAMLGNQQTRSMKSHGNFSPGKTGSQEARNKTVGALEAQEQHKAAKGYRLTLAHAH